MQTVVLIFILLSVIGLIVNIVLFINMFLFKLIPHKYEKIKNFTPSITILKPVRGLHKGDEENFRTFFELDYPKYEIIFLSHIDAKDDPVLKVIERLIKHYPNVDAKIERVEERYAVHEKVNNYIHGLRIAKYDYILISDADVYVKKDYLKEHVKPLSQDAIGVVTSVQTMNDFSSIGTAFEGLGMNADFPAAYTFAYNFGFIDFVSGHSVMFRKEVFKKSNVIEEVKDHLIDDQGIGYAVRHYGGYRIELPRYVVPTRYPKASLKQTMNHILRWARFQRSYAKRGVYIFTLFYYPALWNILGVISGLIYNNGWIYWGVPLLIFVLRNIFVVTGNLLYGNKPRDLIYAWLIPLREFFMPFSVIYSFFLNRFSHAGITYIVNGTRMKRVADEGKN